MNAPCMRTMKYTKIKTFFHFQFGRHNTKLRVISPAGVYIIAMRIRRKNASSNPWNNKSPIPLTKMYRIIPVQNMIINLFASIAALIYTVGNRDSRCFAFSSVLFVVGGRDRISRDGWIAPADIRTYPVVSAGGRLQPECDRQLGC